MYIYTIEYYSAIKKNEVMLFAGKWMALMAQWLKTKRSSSHLKKRGMLPLVQPNGPRASQMAELAEVDRQKIRVSP
jgi:hypothetical protein